MLKVFSLSIFSLIVLTLYQANVFKSIDSVLPKNCQKIPGMQGPEDIINIGDKLLISSSNLVENIQSWKQGGITSYDIKTKKITNLTKSFTKKLNIHGLTAKKSPNKSYWDVYAINHAPIGDEVLHLIYKNNTLILQDTFASNEAYNLNDIEIFNSNSFLTTKDHFFLNGHLKTFENFLRIGQSSVLLINKQKSKVVKDGFTFANGIKKIDSQTYAIASMISKKVMIFNINNKLEFKLKKVIELDFFPDNLSYDLSTHELIVTGHHKILELKKHSHNPSVISPSKSISVNLSNDKKQILLSSEDPLYSGASVVKKVKDKYYIGFIYQNYILECSL